MDIAKVYENIYTEVLNYENKYLVKQVTPILSKYKVRINDINYNIIICEEEKIGWVLLPKEYYNHFHSYNLNNFVNTRFLQLITL